MRYLKELQISLISFALFLGSCIHEYPDHSGIKPGIGDIPNSVETIIDLNIELSWQDLPHILDFNSRASQSNLHRFVFELWHEGSQIYHDIIYLSDDAIKSGILEYKLNSLLSPRQYEISVWYDQGDLSGNYFFLVDDLHEITLTQFSTYPYEDPIRCGFASDYLDLSEFNDIKQSHSYTKKMSLSLPGGRFEIIATDVQQFITENREALFQDDAFSVNLTCRDGLFNAFNSFQDKAYRADEMVYSGKMRLPYDDYEELKIAQGFFFINADDEATMKLSVKNNALSVVSQTEYFSFPVKRGYTTILSGDFLTHPVDGIFNVNNVWEGDIVYEPGK